MELIVVASSGNVMITNAAPDGRFTPFPGRAWTLTRDERISGPNEGSIGPDGYYYFPNSQAPRVHRPYEVFKVKGR